MTAGERGAIARLIKELERIRDYLAANEEKAREVSAKYEPMEPRVRLAFLVGWHGETVTGAAASIEKAIERARKHLERETR